MTVNKKRLMILKKIINSDNDGIDILYERLTKPCCKNKNITEEDITEATAHAFAKMSVDDPELILLLPIFAHGVSEAIKILFKEDK